tara:strand:- start:3496 stop:4155 length:660 start_codon:yes stop_codon:yes gene_type:complete
MVYNIPTYRRLVFFNPRNNTGKTDYEKGFKVNQIFHQNVIGILTARDSIVNKFDDKDLVSKMKRFTDSNYSDRQTREGLFPGKKDGKYLAGDSRGWKLSEAGKNSKGNNHSKFIKSIDYRPFDGRKIYYTPEMVDWGRENIKRNFLENKNIALMICQQTAIDSWEQISITDKIVADITHGLTVGKLAKKHRYQMRVAGVAFLVLIGSVGVNQFVKRKPV